MNYVSHINHEAEGNFCTMDSLIRMAKMDKAKVRKKCSKYGFKLRRNETGEEGLFDDEAIDFMSAIYNEHYTRGGTIVDDPYFDHKSFWTLEYLADYIGTDKATAKKKCSKYGFKLQHNETGDEGLFGLNALKFIYTVYREDRPRGKRKKWMMIQKNIFQNIKMNREDNYFCQFLSNLIDSIENC